MQKYTPAAGLPELREAVAAKTLRDAGYQVPASQVLITNGGKQAVYQAFAVLVDEGDEVLLPAPYWTTYPEAIKLAGGTAVPVLTDEHSGYLASVASLEAARTERTKALVFVSPSNPTGAVYPPALVAEIGLGGRARDLGDHRRDLRAPGLQGTPGSARCRWRRRDRGPVRDLSGWPRPTR